VLVIACNALCLTAFPLMRDPTSTFDNPTNTMVRLDHARRSVSTVDAPPVYVPGEPLTNIRQFARSMMNCNSVQSPGYAIVVVKNNQTLIADSVGIADLQYNTSSDASTLWSIGSGSKSITSVMIGILVDRGLLDWSTEIRDVLPKFKLSNDVASSVTVRDLLSMAMGLSRNDIVWAAGMANDDNRIIGQAKKLKPSDLIRTTFYYNNFGYYYLSKVAESVTNKSWKQLIADEIFTPLGMNNSTATIADAVASGHYAYPHLINAVTGIATNYQPRNLNALTVDQVAAAGSVCLSVGDSAKLLAALNTPNFGGLLSQASNTFLHRAEIMTLYNHDGSGSTSINFLDDTSDPLPFSVSTYGNGWLHGMYKGRSVLLHNGGTLGQSTWIFSFPDDGISLLFVSNMGDVSGLGQYMWDWAIYARDQMMNDTAQSTNPSTICSRVFAVPGFVDNSYRIGAGYVGNFTSVEIAQWTGTYKNDFWGTLTVYSVMPGNRVRAKYGLFEGDFLRDASGVLGWYSDPTFYQVLGFTPTFTYQNGIVKSVTIGANDPDPVFKKL